MGMRRHIKAGARRVGLAGAVVLALATTLAGPAQAAGDVTLVNGGFEDGSTNGWYGSGWATTNWGGYTAPSGSWFGVIEGGCYTNALAQDFTAQAGQVLTGWTFFQATDYWPFNDSGSVELEISGGGHVATVFYANIGQVGSYGGTGWRQWSYTFPSAGNYRVAAYSSNASDCGLSPIVGIDFASAPVDSTAPVITASATSDGAAYTAGEWSKAPVTVHFDCTDDGGVASVTGDQTFGDGDGQTVTGTCTDNAGNEASTTFAGIRVDTVAPTASASATSGGATYTSGTWTNQPVTVTVDCVDDLSGVASGSAAQTLGEGDGQSASGTCTDNAGHTSDVEVTGIKVDTTAPVVSWSGNAQTYRIDQQVSLGCTATDTLSGVASSTCAAVTGPAYAFGLGSHTYSASATDRAGNQSSAPATFVVQAGFESLCSLTTSFSTNAGVANGLCAKLTAAKAAADRGQDKTKQNNLGAYANQVSAQTRKALTSSQAATLLALAATL